MMSIHGYSRRVVVVGCGALGLLAGAGQNAPAQPSRMFRAIRVDVSPLRASAGDPTAAWVQEELPRELARAFAGRMARNGAEIVVRIDILTLGPSTGATVHGGSSQDNISGAAIVGGAETPIRATATYWASPVDQTMIEQSNHDRVSQLVQALVFWVSRDF